MTDRRTLLAGAGLAGLAALPLAARAGAAGTAAGPDYYRLFIDVIRAWKSHDIEAVLAHMAEDVEWYSFVGAPPTIGRDKVRAQLGQLAAKRSAEEWRIFHHAVNGTRLFVEGVDAYTDDAGHRIAVPYAGVIEYRDRLITSWRDYFDLGTMNRMKAGEPVPAAIEPLVSRDGEP